jgi:phosphoenolpyruvate synthase/pyruvate phosphate dikinase
MSWILYQRGTITPYNFSLPLKALYKFKQHPVGAGPIYLLQGNILVCPMTLPDYVPAMKKARAIITNEGGITCHAAIISRELKIPCIVGTKIATQVLKDGDRVEVDAGWRPISF